MCTKGAYSYTKTVWDCTGFCKLGLQNDIHVGFGKEFHCVCFMLCITLYVIVGCHLCYWEQYCIYWIMNHIGITLVLTDLGHTALYHRFSSVLISNDGTRKLFVSAQCVILGCSLSCRSSDIIKLCYIRTLFCESFIFRRKAWENKKNFSVVFSHTEISRSQ